MDNKKTTNSDRRAREERLRRLSGNVVQGVEERRRRLDESQAVEFTADHLGRAKESDGFGFLDGNGPSLHPKHGLIQFLARRFLRCLLGPLQL